MIIFHADGTKALEFKGLNEGDKLVKKLMSDDYVTLHFVLEAPVSIRVGDYINLTLENADGDEESYGKYVVVEEQNPTFNTKTACYEYALKMEADYMAWKNKKLRYNPDNGGSELSFSLTSSIDTHLSIITSNILALGWDEELHVEYYGNTVDRQVAKHVTYDNISIIDALTSICKEFECEWWVESGVIICIGKCDKRKQELDNLEMGVNVSEMSANKNGGIRPTRIFAFGSDRNLPSSYKTVQNPDLTKSAIVQKRLMLPTAQEMTTAMSDLLADHALELSDDGYIQFIGINDETAVEAVFVNDDIYPRTQCYISENPQTYTSTVEEEDGTTTTRTYYRIKDGSGLEFNTSMILEGQTLHILFQSGSLNGMDFECQYNDTEKYYEIVANENYGRFLPDTNLHPSKNDKFVLYNWDSSKIQDSGLIKSASNELLESVVDYILKGKTDPSEYTVTEEAKEKGFTMRELGERVYLINTAFFEEGKEGRVIGMEINLDLPYDHPKYTISENAFYVYQGHVSSDTSELNFNGLSYAGKAPGGGDIYIIKSSDSTPASDSNVLSSKKAFESFISKVGADSAAGLITFLAGLTSNKLARFLKGINVTGDSGFNDGVFFNDTAEFYGGIHAESEVSIVDAGLNVSGGDVNVGNGDVDIDNGKIKAPKGEIDDLTAQKIYVDNLVAKVAHFFELSIDEIKSVGGQIILTDANATIDIVETLDNGNFKCYFKATDGERKISQQFSANDQVVCATFDAATGTSYNVSNKYYWRLVTEVSQAVTKIDGEDYHYIVLSNTDKDSDTTSVPEAGDKIAQLGNRTNTSRQAAIILAAYNSEFLDSGINAPSIVQYNGINNYNLSTHRINVISKGLNSFKGQFSIVANGTETDINTAIDNAAAEQWNDNHPYINQTTGTWWVNQQDTGIPAQGAQGESPIFADIDNEMDSVPCDNEGHASETYTATAIIRGWRGTQALQISSINVKPASPQGIQVTSNLSTGAVTFSVTEGTVIEEVTRFDIDVTFTGINTIYTLYYTMNGVRVGADGKNAIIYSLSPSVSSIIKHKDGTYNVDNISCSRQRRGEDIVTYNYTKDQNFLPNGTVEEEEGVGMTDYIPCANGDNVEWRYGKTQPPSTKVLRIVHYNSSKVMIGTTAYVSTSGAGGVRSFKTSRANSAYLRATFVDEEGYTPYIKVNDVLRWQRVLSHIEENSVEGVITYSIDGGAEQSYTNNQNIAVNTIESEITFFYKVDDKVIDKETIPMVYDGNDGSSITKVSESYRYATNTTGVQPSPTDSSWTTTKPTLQKGAWLFTETTITWSDGSTTTIYSSERNPNDGVAGMSVVITSQSVGYCRRTAAQGPTNNPASLRYSNNYPTNLVKGDWLYTRTVVNYGNGDEEIWSTASYGVSYIGEDGVQGKGISNLSEQYGVSADKNTAPTSWSSTMPSDWGKTKPYLWNREVVTYTEGEPSYSEPHIANVWTEDGRGIDSIVDYYCATDKNDYLDFDDDDEWTTSVQAVTATKKYLWNYEEITYTKANEGGAVKESTDPHIIGVYGDKGDTPVITSQRNGNTTTISADGHEIATILDGESSHTHVKYSNDLEHFTLDDARREVEFIQNVYRNCGYIRNATMTSKSRVMIDFCLLEVLNTGTTVFIMGASSANTSSGSSSALDKRFNLCYYGGYLYAIIDPSQKESGTTTLLGRTSNRVRIPYTLGTRIKVDMDFDRVIVNDKDVYYWPEDCDKTEFSTGYALRIFNTNRAGVSAMVGSGYYFARERIYAMKIWQDGVLTNDLVPYISLSTKRCNLYNRVNGEYAYYKTYSDAEYLRSSHDVGENRLLNSNFADGLNRWLTNAMGDTMTAEVVNDAEKGTCVELMNTDVTTIDATHGIFYSDFDKTRNSYCSTCDDEDALVSFDVKSDVDGAVLEYYARVTAAVSKAGEVECHTFWERKYVRIPKQNAWAYGRFGIAPATANAHIRVTNIKIEYGDDYTPWTPAVDDVESWNGKGKYMGVAITNNATAPTDFNAYTWTKVEGDDGKQGLQGLTGPMGADAEVYLFYQGDMMLHVDSNRVIQGEVNGYLHHIVGGVDSLVDDAEIDFKLDTEEEWHEQLRVLNGFFEEGGIYQDYDAADFDDPHAVLLRYRIDGNVVASASWPIVWDGESQYTADFDDEMLTVPCNDVGVPSVQPSWTTDAHLFKGSDEVDLDINKITVNVPTGITCTYSVVNNTLRVVVSGMTQTAADSNRILVTFYKESAKTNVLASCYCVLNKMKNGANATMYNLLLSDNALHKKKSDQSIEPSSITVKVTKTDGSVSTDLAYNQWQAEGLVVTCTGGTLTNGVVSNPTQKLKFDLHKNNVLIDAETVPLVEDGANGTSIDIKGSRSTRAEIEQIQNPSIGDAYMVSGVSQTDYGHLIVYFGQGDMGSDQSPWEDVGQIKGDNGDNAYFFTAWAKETSSGAIDTTQPILHGSEIAADPSKLTEEYTWWGYATNTTNQEPDDYEDFTWQYVKGDKGDKGDSSYTHFRYSDDGETFVFDDDNQYRQVGFIENTYRNYGTLSQLKTGYIGNTTRIVVDFEILGLAASGNDAGYLFGQRYQSTGMMYALRYRNDGSLEAIMSAKQTAARAVPETDVVRIENVATHTRMTVDMSEDRVIFNGVEYSWPEGHEKKTFSRGNVALRMFVIANGSTIDTVGTYGLRARIYSMQVYQENVLTSNIVPVVDLQTKYVRMYDKVSKSVIFTAASGLEHLFTHNYKNGENIVINSHFEYDENYWTVGSGVTTVVADDAEKGKVLQVTSSNVSSVAYNKNIVHMAYPRGLGLYYADAWLGIDIKASTGNSKIGVYGVNDSSVVKLGEFTIDSSDEWSHNELFIPRITNYSRPRLGFAPLTANCTFEITNIKLEYGGSATAWTPSLDDPYELTPTGKWIGILVDNNEEASDVFSDYTWHELPEGSSGAGISNVEHYYLVNDMATGVTHETTGWSTTPQVTTAQNKYLWEYVEVTFTDGRTPTVTPPTRTGMFAESAMLYDIQVMSNTLHINKEKIYDGEALVEVHKIEGSTDTKLNTTDDGIKVRYHVNTEEDVADWDVVSGGTSGNFYLARYDGEDPTDYGGFAKALIIEALDSENHVLRTESVSITEDGGDGAQGESGTSPYIARFDNQMVSIPCDSEGNPLNTVSWTTKAQLWHGSELVEYETVGQFHYNIIQSGLSRSLTPSTDGIGVTVNGLTGTNDFNTVTVYFYETAEDASAAATAYNTSHDAASLQVGALAWCTAIVNRLRRGAQGDNPSVYDIVLGTTAVKVGSNGVCNPSKLYLSVRKTQGTTITQYLVAGNGTSGWTGQGLTLKLLVSVNGGTAAEVTTFSTEGTPAKSYYAIPNNTTAITAELYKGDTMIDAQGVSLTKDGESGDDAEYFKMVQSATTTYAKVVLTDSTLNGNSDTLHDELRISLNYEVWKIKDGGNTAEIVNTTDNLYIRYRPDNVNTFETLTKGATSTISTAALPSAWSGFVKENSIVKMAGYSSKTSKPNGVVVQLVKVTDGTAVVVDQLYVPVMLEAGSSLLVTKDMISATVQNSQLIGNLPSGETTVVGYISNVNQKADEIRTDVTATQSSINNINGQLAQKVDTSSFTQRATSIESKVQRLQQGDTRNLFGKTIYTGEGFESNPSNKWEFVTKNAYGENTVLKQHGALFYKGHTSMKMLKSATGNTYEDNKEVALYSPYLQIQSTGKYYLTCYLNRSKSGSTATGIAELSIVRYTSEQNALDMVGGVELLNLSKTSDWSFKTTIKEIDPSGAELQSSWRYRLRLRLRGGANTYVDFGTVLLYYSANGTALTANDFSDWYDLEAEEYSHIRQTANEIELKVKDTGINIDQKKITLSAENTIINSDLTVKALETMPTEDGAYAMMQGSELGFFGSVATTPNIRIGVDENGSAVIKFYDNSGELRCWLGAYGFQYYSGYHTGEVTGVVSESWQAWGCEELSNQTLTTRKNIIDKFIYGAPGTRVGDTIIYDSQFAPYNGHYFHTSKTPSEQNKFGDPLHGKWYMQRQYVVSRIITRTTPSVDGSEPETVEVKLLSFNVYYFDGGVKTETRTVYHVEDAENKGVYYFATQDGDIIAGSVGWTIAQYLNITL